MDGTWGEKWHDNGSNKVLDKVRKLRIKIFIIYRQNRNTIELLW